MSDPGISIGIIPLILSILFVVFYTMREEGEDKRRQKNEYDRMSPTQKRVKDTRDRFNELVGIHNRLLKSYWESTSEETKGKVFDARRKMNEANEEFNAAVSAQKES